MTSQRKVLSDLLPSRKVEGSRNGRDLWLPPRTLVPLQVARPRRARPEPASVPRPALDPNAAREGQGRRGRRGRAGPPWSRVGPDRPPPQAPRRPLLPAAGPAPAPATAPRAAPRRRERPPGRRQPREDALDEEGVARTVVPRRLVDAHSAPGPGPPDALTPRRGQEAREVAAGPVPPTPVPGSSESTRVTSSKGPREVLSESKDVSPVLDSFSKRRTRADGTTLRGTGSTRPSRVCLRKYVGRSTFVPKFTDEVSCVKECV